MTRPREQAESLVAGLEHLGAEVIAAPLIRVVDPADPGPLRLAAENIAGFDWIVFTSANGVRQFWKYLNLSSKAEELARKVAICAVGPATAAAVEAEGGRVAIVPEEFIAESVVRALQTAGLSAKDSLLLPQAELARPVLSDALRNMGVNVSDITAYRTIPDDQGVGQLRHIFQRNSVDVITFTSTSTVRNFGNLVSKDLTGIDIASIGPITSSALHEFGWRATVEAEVHTADGLLAAIERHYAGAAA